VAVAIEEGGYMSPRVVPENRVSDIVRAAVVVFGNKGFRLARMEEIAEEAGVSAGTLYNHFRNKVHLFSYVLQNGIPEDGGPPPLSEDSIVETEKEMLDLMKRRLKTASRFESVSTALRKKRKDIDLEKEFSDILREWWELLEGNRVQISILEKSLSEFPELAGIYDRYGRRHLLEQIEKYLTVRTKQGIIRSLNSIPGMARMLMEAISWFGWKQVGGKPGKPYLESEIVPDLVAMMVDGLKA
jgi:AcrR family transcriptional regulator